VSVNTSVFTTSSHDSEEREAYEAPSFEDLGSFVELTQGAGGSTIFKDFLVGSRVV